MLDGEYAGQSQTRRRGIVGGVMADIRDDSKKGRSAQRDKKSRKMTRSEASVQNPVAHGDEQRSDRRSGEYFNLQQPQTEHISSPEQHASVRETIAKRNCTERTAQDAFRSDDAPSHTVPMHETPLRHAPSLEGGSEQGVAPRQSDSRQSTMHHSQFIESADNNVGQSEQNVAQHGRFVESAASHSQNMRRQASHSPDTVAPTVSADEAAPTEHSGRLRSADTPATQSDAIPTPDNHSRLRFSGDTPPDSGTKSQLKRIGTRNQHFTEDARETVDANTSTDPPAAQYDSINPRPDTARQDSSHGNPK